ALREALAAGRHAAGFLAYEAGLALEPRLAPLTRPADEGAPPLVWFGLFDEREEHAAEALPRLLPDPAGAHAALPRPLIEEADYRAAVARILGHIEAGDVYQANFTFPAEVALAGHPLALYAALRERARAGHGGIVFTGEDWLLSFSPELFFALEGGRIAARPMKGTARRGRDAAGDRGRAEGLAADPKQRAENLMIVDLVRNDLARVARTGSVEVPALFTVETYPTVLQMTSTVTAELARGKDAIDLIAAAFPCGSVTGAPKIRAMELLAGLERGPRGPYCGSIGWLAPEGDAAFNVAIRTLLLRQGESRARLGLGSGIVADSEPGAEWRECLAKGRFVGERPRFDLIETMRFEPGSGVAALALHIARLERSARELGFAFDRHAMRNELQSATFRWREPAALRFMLAPSGAMAVELAPLPAAPREPVEVAVAPLPVADHDFRLRHKTSDRGFYDRARQASRRFEILFEDGAGRLTEGSFTTIFVERGGALLTPPLGLGLLPALLRARLIAEGKAEEAVLRRADLEGGFLIGNALRGLIRARL
ncbi:MAG: aminodeoxychorismate synthase component I, partial [Sphingomonadaceae bacterium]